MTLRQAQSLRTAWQGGSLAELGTTDSFVFPFPPIACLSFLCSVLLNILMLVDLSQRVRKEIKQKWEPNVASPTGWPHLNVSAQALVGWGMGGDRIGC